jgi:hypothetical protein
MTTIPTYLSNREWYRVTVTFAFGGSRVVFEGFNRNNDTERAIRDYLGADTKRIAVTDVSGSLLWESNRP